MATGLLVLLLAVSARAAEFPEWCALPATVHVLQNETCKTYSSLASRTIEWHAMRGEQEAKQVLLDTRSWTDSLNMSGNISVTFGDLRGHNDVLSGKNLQWFQVGYVFCRHTTRYADSGGGWRPDPLLPPSSKGNAVLLEVPVTTPLWISVHVPYSAASSEYSGNVTLTVSLPNSEVLLQKIPVQLSVWNISLPNLEDSKFPAIFSFSANGLLEVYGDRTASVAPLFFQLLTEQRVGGDYLYTTHPTDLALAKQLAQSGVQWLSLYDVYGAAGVHGGDDETGRVKGACVEFNGTLVDKVMAILTPVVEQYNAAGILGNMFVYGFDEVDSSCEQSIRNMYGAIKVKWPQLRTVATLNWPPPSDLPLDVWVLQYENYDEAEAAKWVAAGKEQWWYHCIEPSSTQYLNTFIERPLLMARLLFWLASAHPVSGWLYYSVAMWRRHPASSSFINRLNGTARTDFDPANYIWLPRTDIFANGDGNFVYPGSSGPVATVRLMNIRDGFEDAELFRKLPSPAAAGELVEPLVRSATDYTLDPLLLEKQRILAASMVVRIHST